MKYISIDIETTGLNRWGNQILQVALVYEDTDTNLPLGELPHLNFYIEHDDELRFQEGALMMHINSGLLENYYAANDKVSPQEMVIQVVEWLKDLGYEENDEGKIKFNVAGKNYASFDKRFLHEIWEWQEVIQEHQRTLDPAMLYVDWDKDDKLPDLKTCLERGAPPEGRITDVTHDALEDAFDVIRAIRGSLSPLVYNKVGI